MVVLLAGPGDDRVVLSLERYSEFDVHLGPGDDRLVARQRPGQPLPEFGGVCLSYEHARRPVDVDLGRGVARGEGTDRLIGVRCVYGGPGRDHVVGSSAADYIEDNWGPLILETGAGDDHVNGSNLADSAILGPGDDTFSGAGSADRAFGGAGNDLLNGDDGVDVLHGGTGDDEVNGAYYCYSNSDLLPVSDGSPNALYGGAGNDYLIGDIGNDLLDGGQGTDSGFGQEDGLLDTLVSLERPTMC